MDGRTARAVLGVAEHVDPQALRRAYRTRLHDAHPDHGGTREQFDDVRRAFAALETTIAARPRVEAPAARPAPVAVMERHGFCAYDSPVESRRRPTRDFADVLAAAMARVAA